MQDNATDYVTRVRYLAIWCINLHRYFTVLHFLEVKIPERQRCPILTLRRLLRRVLVLVLNIVSRNDASYGADTGYAEAVDSYCNMDPTRIILENVGRNFHGNYSCQVRAVLNIAAIVTITPHHGHCLAHIPARANLSFAGEKQGRLGRSLQQQ